MKDRKKLKRNGISNNFDFPNDLTLIRERSMTRDDGGR